MSKVKAIKTYKIQSVFQDFPDEFMKIPTTNCIAISQLHGVLQKRYLVKSYRNTFKHQKTLDSGSELLIPYSSQTFLRSSNINFVKKITKAFLFSHIPLYNLNNKHIKNLFHNTGRSLPSEIICRKTMLQLSTDELQRTKNAVLLLLLLLLLSASPYSGSPQRESIFHFSRSTSSPSLAPTLSMSSLAKSIHLPFGLPLFLLPGTAISIIVFPT